MCNEKIRTDFLVSSGFLFFRPNGKGKDEKIAIDAFVAAVYQFPMGKVKAIVSINNTRRTVSVSIPNGKGKDISVTQIYEIISKYQFPMGKAKSMRN